ncbi:MAG: hypothetical protein KDA77_16140, partial [Planctomycetaceae bacterium]|nr:hypothetical protein [Planctomycetaceae bacterium]
GDSDSPAKVELLQDGQSVAQEDIVSGSNDSQRLEFSINSDKASSLEAVLTPGSFDSLPSDNRAFLKIPQARSLSVFIDPDLASYRYAVADNKELELYPEAENAVGPAEYDLIISASEKNLEKQALVKLGVGFVPEDLKKYITLETKLTDVVDWNRSASLLRHVELNDVQITEQPVWAENAGVENLEELGYEVLVHGRLGPLLLQKRNAGDLEFYFLFNTDRSTLPYRVGFPIMVSNLIQLTLQEAGIAEVQAAATPVLPAVEYLPENQYEIKTPDGKQLSTESNKNGLVSGVAALRVGKYVISGAGANSDEINVSLLNPLETSLVSVEEIQFSEVPVTASQAQIDSDKPLWSEFALVAFILLLIEWWYFQRRPAGIPS